MSEERWGDVELDALLERGIGALDEYLGSVIDFQAARDDLNARLDAIVAPDIAQPAEPAQVPGVIPLSLEELSELDLSSGVEDRWIDRDRPGDGIDGFGV